MLLVVLLVLAGGLVAVVGGLVTVSVRRRRPAVAPAAVAVEPIPAEAVRGEPEFPGPSYGLIGPPGPEYAPQPVMASAARVPQVVVPAGTYQPHRPELRAATNARPTSSRRGAHRRGADAKEIARLHALHESGVLSEDELTSLKARLA